MDVMDTLWSHLNEKRVACSNKLEEDIKKYIKKVRDIYVPSGSKGLTQCDCTLAVYKIYLHMSPGNDAHVIH